MLTEAKGLLHQEGTGIVVKDRLDTARELADHDARLLTEVARVALEFDAKLALAIARDAVHADDSYLPAHVALGAALAANGRYEESRGQLERAYEDTGHGLDAGFQLALTLEALAETSGARTLLTDLVARFPDSVEAKQALARMNSLVGHWPAPGTAGTAVAGWMTDRWWETAQLLIGVQKNGETVEAIGLDGKSRWALTCGGKPNDLLLNETGRLAVLSTDRQGCLLDLAAGTVLAKLPEVTGYVSLDGLAWRGDLIAVGRDVPTGPAGPHGYFGTDWQVYRLTSGTTGKVDLHPLYEAKDGSRRAALSRDGKTLFSWFGNHGAGRPRLFQEGRKVTEYPGLSVGNEFFLDPRDDRYYCLGYSGVLQARSLDGQVLWQAQAAKQGFPMAVWTDAAGQVRIAVPDNGGATVYSDQGERLWTTPGSPLFSIGVAAVPYLITRDGRDIVLYDGSGQAVARYPGAAGFTRDGKAVVRLVDRRIDLYRLP